MSRDSGKTAADFVKEVQDVIATTFTHSVGDAQNESYPRLWPIIKEMIRDGLSEEVRQELRSKLTEQQWADFVWMLTHVHQEMKQSATEPKNELQPPVAGG